MELPKEGGRPSSARAVTRLQEEHNKVVSGCQEKIQHWKKVESDYDALQERLGSLPEKLSYDIMVPFGPLAFMPGRLVQTNEVTVLLGDNWFAKCSAKQATGLVDHRKKHVRKALEDLQEVMKNFESRVEFTKEMEKMSKESSDYFDIREEVSADAVSMKGKRRTAHQPHSIPKSDVGPEVGFREEEARDPFMDNAALWARLEELERQEELRGELTDIKEDGAPASDSCNEENKENLKTDLNVNRDHVAAGGHTKSQASILFCVNGSQHSDDEDNNAASCKNSIATIYFSHTVEPKRVRINTGKNTTLKFSEKKEEAKRKRKNSNGNGHSGPELPVIKTPADIYRVFVDLVNGEYVPRKSIMKSRSREDSVCSDTSENSSHELDDRRGYQRNISIEDNIFSDHSEEDDRTHKKLSPVSGLLEQAFSGTVVEKEPFCLAVPITSIAHPSLPTIQEKKGEEFPEEGAKRVSKFKAARMQQSQ